MNQTTIQSALEVLQRPDKVILLIADNAPLSGEAPAPPSDLNERMAAALVVAIAEHVGDEDEKFATLYNAVKQRNEMPDRDVPFVFDYMAKAYEFLQNHWAVVYFVIAVLNKKGYFNSLKEDTDLKAFFEVFFEEDIKDKKDNSKSDE